MTDYCTQTDVEQEFGVTNVAKWADLDNDNDATKIAARIARALVIGTAAVDDALRGGPYTIPFSGTLPTIIVHVAAVKAGVWLYEGRGVQDFNEQTGNPVHQLQFAARKADAALRDIKSGAMFLDLPRQLDAPQVVHVHHHHHRHGCDHAS